MPFEFKSTRQHLLTALSSLPGVDVLNSDWSRKLPQNGGLEVSVAVRDRSVPQLQLMIATPAYDGKLTAGYFLSAIDTIKNLSAHGVGVDFSITGGDGLVSRARARLVNDFLSDDALTHVLFIDSDISWRWQDVLRMLRTECLFVCAAYRKREDRVGFPFRFVNDDPSTAKLNSAGLIEIAYGPGGFMLLTRDAVRRLVAAYPDRRCMLCDGDWYARDNRFAYDLFPTPINDDGIMLSEDYGLCWLWNKAGLGPIYLAPDVRLGHTGDKTWVGCFSDYAYARPVSALAPEVVA